jgi:hypothetical protein
MAPRSRHEIASLQRRLPAEEHLGIAVADRVAGVHALAPLPFEQSFPTLPVLPPSLLVGLLNLCEDDRLEVLRRDRADPAAHGKINRRS